VSVATTSMRMPRRLGVEAFFAEPSKRGLEMDDDPLCIYVSPTALQRIST
jgi:hypothetical protein